MYSRKFTIDITEGSNSLEHNINYSAKQVTFEVSGKPQEFTWYNDTDNPTTKIIIDSTENVSDVTVVILYDFAL